MSFIYAEKYIDEYSGKEMLNIHCDTRIPKESISGANFSREEQMLIGQYGIVKSTIVAPEACISFAGNNLLYATELFRKLCEKGSFLRKDIMKLAYEIHNSAPENDIEFIISTYENGRLHIDSIKDKKVNENCPFDWIGSYEAFVAFQKQKNSTYPKGKPIHEYTYGAFSNVVAGCGDSSVGGFHIAVAYNYSKSSFQYQESKSFTALDQIVRPGESVIFDTSREAGGYSFETVSSDIQNVVFIVDQIQPAILYSRQFRGDKKDSENKNLFSLMLPMLILQDKNGQWIQYR